MNKLCKTILALAGVASTLAIIVPSAQAQCYSGYRSLGGYRRGCYVAPRVVAVPTYRSYCYPSYGYSSYVYPSYGYSSYSYAPRGYSSYGSCRSSYYSRPRYRCR